MRLVLRILLLAIGLAVGASGRSFAASPPLVAAQANLINGQQAYVSGDYPDAIDNFKLAVAQFSDARDLPDQVTSAIGVAASYEGVGDYLSAMSFLRQFTPAGAPDAATSVRLQLALAQAMVLSHSDSMGMVLAPDTSALLSDARQKSEQIGDPYLEAQVLDEQGNLSMAELNADDAMSAYTHALQLAQETNHPALICDCASNAAVAALADARDLSQTLAEKVIRPRDLPGLVQRRKEAIALGDHFNEQALADVQRLPLSRQRLYLELTIGQTSESLAEFSTPLDPSLRLIAFELYSRVIDEASFSGDKLAPAYAYGFIGHLYETESPPRVSEAMDVTRAALNLCQQCHDAASLYRWQWQMGRLFRLQGDNEEAVDELQRSVATLREARKEIASGGGNQPSTSQFRQNAEGPYYELADLYLQRAQTEPESTAQPDLQAAQDVIEELKTTQLQNYLGERCDALFASRQRDIKGIGANTVVIYYVPLASRTVILVGESGGDESTYRVHQLTVPVSQQKLFATVRELRVHLTDTVDTEYLQPSAQLYDWLIRPVEREFAGRAVPVDTLVFVPDSVLRTIPMAALYDSEKQQFLIQQYAVAVSPGLKLNPAEETRTGNTVHILANGVSESVMGFAPLTGVQTEFDRIQSIYGGNAVTLLNSKFMVNKFDQQMEDEEYSIVHIASHGKFADKAENSFVLAYDGPIDLNHLQMIVEPSRFKGRQVDLLTLSACETAAGDDRAALGLAGVAVKAGARSALASLWSGSDEGTALLMPEFYRQLQYGRSKAQALQAAQELLLEGNSSDKRFTHPLYWAPFILVGDWR